MSASQANVSNAFVDAILNWQASNRVPVIAEIKLRSPKHGKLMDTDQVAERVAEFDAGGAVCLSVVTGHWYGGDLDLLRRVRELTSRPLLRKDFITSRRAIDESLQAGADAILLTKRLLTQKTLVDLATYALQSGITPFLEVADPQELQQTALPPGAILAFNNREIRDQERGDQGIEQSLNLRRLVGSGNSPTALVSASGINQPTDISTLIAAGFDAALVATALLRTKDVKGFLRSARDLALQVRQHDCRPRQPRNAPDMQQDLLLGIA